MGQAAAVTDRERLIERYASRSYNLAYHLTGDRRSASVIVLEAFGLDAQRERKPDGSEAAAASREAWFAHRPTFEDRPAPEDRPELDLYRAVAERSMRSAPGAGTGGRSTLRQWLDAEGGPDEGPLVPDCGLPPVAPRDDAVFAALVREVIESCHLSLVLCLPMSERLPYVLRVGIGLSYRDIAAVTGETPAAVKRHLHRARTRLEKFFIGRCQWRGMVGACTCASQSPCAFRFDPEILKRADRRARSAAAARGYARFLRSEGYRLSSRRRTLPAPDFDPGPLRAALGSAADAAAGGTEA